MKYIVYFILTLIMVCPIIGCSPNIQTEEQLSALNRLDSAGIIQSDIWNKNRDEILRQDPSLVTQEPASSCYKEIQNYYGYPARMEYVFKKIGDLSSIAYMINFDANSEAKDIMATDIYPMILDDLIMIFGENYTGKVVNSKEIEEAIEEHNIGSYVVTWNTHTVPKPSLSFSVFSDDIIIMVIFEA
jgi:hypothetical protein